jgi:hypothetical protein
MGKPEYEFFDPQRSPAHGWQPMPGDRTGQLEELILSGEPDSGNYTRLLRFPPGADTSPNGVLTHEVWEEVWIIEGSLHDIQLDQTFTAGMYACRPPGMKHGPWTSPEGALTFEIRYRDGAG